MKHGESIKKVAGRFAPFVIRKHLRAYYQTKFTLCKSTLLTDLKFVCVHCHILSLKEKNLDFKIYNDRSYEPNRLTRLLSLQPCTFHICQIVLANGLKSKKTKGKRGHLSSHLKYAVVAWLCSNWSQKKP